MFREVTRKKQVLSKEEVVGLLKKQLRGVLSMLGDDDYPYGLPINHYYNEEDGCLYFHGGKTGHKIDSIRKHDKVSFCVYDEGFSGLCTLKVSLSSVRSSLLKTRKSLQR